MRFVLWLLALFVVADLPLFRESADGARGEASLQARASADDLSAAAVSEVAQASAPALPASGTDAEPERFVATTTSSAPAAAPLTTDAAPRLRVFEIDAYSPRGPPASA